MRAAPELVRRRRRRGWRERRWTAGCSAQSAAYLPPTDALLDLLRQAGFIDVDRSTMTGGAVQLLTGTRA